MRIIASSVDRIYLSESTPSLFRFYRPIFPSYSRGGGGKDPYCSLIDSVGDVYVRSVELYG
jgi:hypothetical protein